MGVNLFFINDGINHYEIGEMPASTKEYYLSYGNDFDTAWLNAMYTDVYVCDHVAILDGGVVVELGEVKEIFANPRTAAARRLVAPNGGSAARDLSSFAPDDHVVRVTFNGSSAAKPLVASLAAEKGILVSVLSADTRDLSGQCYGSMLLKLPKDTEEAKQAAAYMRSQPGVTVEEVTGE